MRYKIAIGYKVPSSYMELSLFKRVLLLKTIDARLIRKQGLRDLLKRAECLSLSEITNLKKVVYDLDEDGLADLISLQISHCNQMECLVNTMGMPAEFKILPNLEILSLEHLDCLKVIFHGRTSQNWCSKLRDLKLSNLTELKPHVLPVCYSAQLAIVEVRDCTGLKHILSSTVTSEINMNVEGYDFPFLKKLDLQNLPKLQSLWGGDTTTSNCSCPPFHEKINMHSLEELYLSSLENIEELWESSSANETFSKLQTLILEKMPTLKLVLSKELCEGSLSFRNLKKVNIIECDILQSLCPSTFPASFSKLESLEIVACGYLEEVIKSDINEDNIIEFPSLQRLKLENLSSLTYFCQESCNVNFPFLKHLFLSSLPKMLTFLEPKNSDTSCCSATKGEAQSAQTTSSSLVKHKLFNGETVFPSLENLELSSMEEIEELVEEEHAAVAFPKLISLTVNALCKLKSIPESMLYKLQQLKVQNCRSLHGLFELKSASSILSLRNLELFNVRCLKHIPWTFLPNLHSLVIHGCLLGPKTMVSSSDVAQGKVLPKLEFMDIEQCDHLEEIVSKECERELGLLENGTFMFPRLKQVKFNCLPRFAAFSSGSYEAIFPALEKVEIIECPSLMSFTMGALATPKMKYLQVDQEIVLDQIDVNHFVGCQKQGWSVLEKGLGQEELLQSRGERKRCRNEATKEIVAGGCLHEDSPLATNGELITNNANSKQSTFPISV